jgi:hypothetical protein
MRMEALREEILGTISHGGLGPHYLLVLVIA